MSTQTATSKETNAQTRPPKPKAGFFSHFKLSIKTAPYYFLLPAILVFGAFMVYPVISSLILSFQTFDMGEYSFVALDNYKTLMGDPIFWQALGNTCIYLIIQVPAMVVLSLTFATLLDQKFLKGRTLFRMSLFLPSITALVAYALIFKLLFNTEYCMINYMLSRFGVDKIDWLNTAWGARFTIIAGITWRWTGYNMIIMIAGLQAIPLELYESADIDGAGAWKKFWYITVPMMKSIILFVSITSTIGTLQMFDESFILTNGGPDNATITVGHYLYNSGFRYFKFGYAAAISYVLVLVIGILSFLQFKFTNGGED